MRPVRVPARARILLAVAVTLGLAAPQRAGAITGRECLRACAPKLELCDARCAFDPVACSIFCFETVLRGCQRTEGRSCDLARTCEKWRRLACDCLARRDAELALGLDARSCPTPPRRCRVRLADCRPQRVVGCCHDAACTGSYGCRSNDAASCLAEAQTSCTEAGAGFEVLPGGARCEAQPGCAP